MLMWTLIWAKAGIAAALAAITINSKRRRMGLLGFMLLPLSVVDPMLACGPGTFRALAHTGTGSQARPEPACETAHKGGVMRASALN